MIPSGKFFNNSGVPALLVRSSLHIPACAVFPHTPSNSRTNPSADISEPRLAADGLEYNSAWLLTVLPYNPAFHNELVSPVSAGAEMTTHSGVLVAVGDGVGDGRVAVIVGLGEAVGVRVTVAVMVVVGVTEAVFTGCVLVRVGVRER